MNSVYAPHVKIASVGGLMLLLMVAWFNQPRHHQPNLAPSQDSTPQCDQEIWARGVHRFDLSIHAQKHHHVTAITASGQLHVMPSTHHVELALVKAVVQGKAARPNQRVRLQLDSKGQLISMAFPPEIQPNARGVLAFLARAMAGPTQAPQPGVDPSHLVWQQQTKGPEGHATTTFQQVCTANGHVVQQATRTNWDRLYILGNQPIKQTFIQNDAQTIKTFSTHLDTLQHHTAITQKHPTPLNLINVLTMRRLAHPTTDHTARTSSWIVANAHPDMPESPSKGKQLLTKRVAGLTWAQMHDAIIKHDASGVMPHHERWLWRATGLLKLHPELSHKLAKLALDDRLAQPGKLLIMDLLANVGHTQAQEAILTVLNDPEVYGTPAYAALGARTLLLTTPSLQTAQAFAKHFEDAPTRSTFATSAAILGASIARIDPDQRPAFIKTLLSPCARTCDADTRADLLVGLGNAGAKQATTLAKAQLQHSKHPEHTTQAIMALRRVHTTEARKLLFDAIAQPHTTQAALNALSQHTLTEDEARTLITILKHAPLTQTQQPALLNTLTQLGKTHPQLTLNMIDHLRDQNRIKGRTRAALMRLRRKVALIR